MMHLKSVYLSFHVCAVVTVRASSKQVNPLESVGIRRFHAQGESVTGSSISQSGDKSMTLNEPTNCFTVVNGRSEIRIWNL